MGAGEREEGEEPAIQAMFTYVRGKTKFENKSSLQCSVIWPRLKNNNLQQQQWKLILANVASGPSAQLIIYMPTTLPDYPRDPDLPDIALPLSQ